MNDVTNKKFAVQSQKKMRWAVKLYSEWRVNHIKTTVAGVQIMNVDLDRIFQFNKEYLCYSLCRFIREIKKMNGEEYPPSTVREIIIMIQMYLHERGFFFWKLLDHPEFVKRCNVVDNIMKEHHSTGLGVCKSAEVILMENEVKLFESGVLGKIIQRNC